MFENSKSRGRQNHSPDHHGEKADIRKSAMGFEPASNAAARIQRQRDYEQKIERLTAEFHKIDKNHDGALEKDELLLFLNDKVCLVIEPSVRRSWPLRPRDREGALRVRRQKPRRKNILVSFAPHFSGRNSRSSS